MLFLCFGENSYSLTQRKRAIKKKAKQMGAEVFVFNIEKGLEGVVGLDLSFLKNLLHSSSLFSSKKVIVIEDALNNLDSFLKERLEEFFKQEIKTLEKRTDTVVYFFEKKLKKSERFSRFLIKKAQKVEEYKSLKGIEKERFLTKEADLLGIKIKREALRKLIFCLDNRDEWSLINELQKISNFKNSEEINSLDVEQMVEVGLEKDIFATIDAIGKRDKKLALQLVRKQLENGVHPLQLFSLVVYQFRTLLVVKDIAIREEKGEFIKEKRRIHPFVFNKLKSFSRLFSLERLKILYKKLAQIDNDVKNGKFGMEGALEFFIIYV